MTFPLKTCTSTKTVIEKSVPVTLKLYLNLMILEIYGMIVEKSCKIPVFSGGFVFAGFSAEFFRSHAGLFFKDSVEIGRVAVTGIFGDYFYAEH